MNKIIAFCLAIIVTIGVTILIGCKKEKVPAITTSTISNIAATTATIGGNITDEGSSSVISRGVCWSTNPSPTITDNKTTDGAGVGSFSSNLIGLIPNTNYFVRAYASNSEGTGYGIIMTFKSLQVILPELNTVEITDILQTSAKSGGNITSDGGASITIRGVCWSLAQNPTTGNNKTEDAYGIGSYASLMTNLVPNTAYFVRAYATNSAGTSYGNQINFTTAATVPTLTTIAISGLNFISATSGGNITSDGGDAVTARGVCWSTTTSPTISNSKTTDGTGINSYSSNLTELSGNTKYYVRAYATNDVGTGYGNEISFTTPSSPIVFNPNLTYGTVTDIDGNVYKTITIGTQTWMAENVKTTHYNNTYFISIPYMNPYSSLPRVTGVYWWYNNNIANKDTYGALYNWDAVSTGNLCPTGWHVPTYYEWTTLMNNLGGWGVVDGKLKEAGISHWKSPNVDASNSSGFTAVPAGKRDYSGWFGNIGYSTYFWTTTVIGASGVIEVDSRVYRFELRNNNDFGSTTTFRNWFDDQLTYGYSVRCIKN